MQTPQVYHPQSDLMCPLPTLSPTMCLTPAPKPWYECTCSGTTKMRSAQLHEFLMSDLGCLHASLCVRWFLFLGKVHHFRIIQIYMLCESLLLQVDAGKVVAVEVRSNTLRAIVHSENLFRERADPYTCWLLPWELIACTCASFKAVGGYCKHLRAALLKVCVAACM